MNGQYTPGEIVFGNWTLTRLIGEGSFGRVFEAEREDFGRVYKAAIKIITIPQSQSEIKSVMADGMDIDSVTAYYRGFVEELVDEFSIMSRLKGNSNVVSYEDHTVVQHKVGIGWDILIRMELLTPLIDYAQSTTLTRKDVTQLGIDMCKALEVCQKFNIVHRDIKPENIFVSEIGDFKLGDFGIARTVEKTTGGLSKKGTYTYMAPEIYRGDAYGSSVDVYSLGIVLYRLLNDNRTPFLPEYPAPISHSDREKALAKRISGAQLPRPKNADGRLAEIVMKACAYDPKERYSSPMQMRDELEAILYNRIEASLIYPQGDETPVKPVEYANMDVPREELPVQETTESLFKGTVITGKTESPLGDISGKTERVFGADANEKTDNTFDSTTSDYSQPPFLIKKNKVAVIIAFCVLAALFTFVIVFIASNNKRNNAPAVLQSYGDGPKEDEYNDPAADYTEDESNDPAADYTEEKSNDSIVYGTGSVSSEPTVDYITIKGERYSTSLTDLRLINSDLQNEDIVDLKYMANLTELFLNWNQISDITALSGLTNLTGLYLSGNQISDITPLSSLESLTELNLRDNKISDITPLSGLTGLTWVHLSDNQISDWSPTAHVSEVYGRP